MYYVTLSRSGKDPIFKYIHMAAFNVWISSLRGVNGGD